MKATKQNQICYSLEVAEILTVFFFYQGERTDHPLICSHCERTQSIGVQSPPASPDSRQGGDLAASQLDTHLLLPDEQHQAGKRGWQIQLHLV